MRRFIPLFLILSFCSGPAWGLQPQPVPVPEDIGLAPQIQVNGTGLVSVDIGRSAESTKSETGINFSDSEILVGGAQRLYDGAIGSIGFGGLSTDQTNQGTGTSLFLNQAFVDYQAERIESFIGRTDNPTAHLVDFPTFRGDDLIELLNPLNPFSNGQNIEEHRYVNVADVTTNQGLTYFESFHAQHLINSAGIGTSTGINSFGVSFNYMAPPDMEAFHRVPAFGIGYEHFSIQNQSPGGLHQIYAGGVINLNESVTDRIDIRLQDILGLGSNLTGFQTITDSYQANSNVIAASIRYFHSPFGIPGYQLALTGGYKNYFKVDQANTAGLALTVVRQLGHGFDLIGQYKGQWRGSALSNVEPQNVAYEQVGQIGFVYNFETTLNQQINPRRTLLNQQHQYIPN